MSVEISEQIRALGRAQRMLGMYRELVHVADKTDLVAFRKLDSNLEKYEGEVQYIENQLVSLGVLNEADRTPIH